MSTNINNPSNAGAVKIFEADEVEIHYEAGDPIPTTVTVKGKPNAVNFIAKTTQPYSTVAIFQAGEGDRVAWAQFAHHNKLFNEDFELRAVMRKVRVDPDGRQHHIYSAMRSVPFED